MGTIGQEIIAGLTEAVGYMDGTANKAQFGIHDFAPVNAPEHVDVKANRLPLQAENTPPCLDMERRTPRRAAFPLEAGFCGLHARPAASIRGRCGGLDAPGRPS